MLVFGLAQLAGALTVVWRPELPHPGLFLLSVPLVLAAAVRPRTRFLAAFWLGAALAAWQAGRHLDDRLDAALEGEIITITGEIHGLVERETRRTRFLFVTESAEDAAGHAVRVPHRLRLNLYEDLAVATGERWRWQVKVRRPRGFANPGGFDYERWLFAQGIGGTGYVYRPASAERLAPGNEEWRAAIAARVAAVADGPAGGLLRGLATGDRTAIAHAQWETLRRTGTAHLMAISGLHVGLVAGLGLLLFGFARRRWLPFTRPGWPAFAAGGLTLLYGALSGFSLPVRRALTGTGLLLTALASHRRLAPGHAFGAALALVLCLDPLAPLDIGFWLSFGAVAAILYLLAGRRPRGSRLRRALEVQAGLFLLLAPLLLTGFGQLPLVSPLANLIAMPVFGVAIVPGVLLALLLLPWPAAAHGVFRLLGEILSRLMDLLEWLAALDPGFSTAMLPPAAVLLASAAGVLIAAPRALPGRWLALWLVLPAIGLNQPARPEGMLAVHALDVGQGLAVIVETREHTLVYDTGPGFGASDAAEMVIVPFLRARGREPDTVLVSHGHNDHEGGLQTLTARYPAAERMGRARDAGVEDCAGRAWEWDGVRFRVLYPGSGDAGSDNDISCVLLIEAGTRRVLLTGDIEALAEERLLRRFARELRADVVVVPHHGSLTSSTPAFVQAVAPAIALVGAGFGNRWNFPRPEVVARWRDAGARVLTTGEHGAISVEIGAGDLKAGGFRAQRRLWRAPAPFVEPAKIKYDSRTVRPAE